MRNAKHVRPLRVSRQGLERRIPIACPLRSVPKRHLQNGTPETMHREGRIADRIAAWFSVAFLLVVFPVQAAGAVSTAAIPDYIYLKAPADQLGFVRVRGEVDDVTRDYVVFVPQDQTEPHLYTRQEVRRIELSEDDRKFRDVVERFWNEQRNLQRGKRDAWEWTVDVVTELLPGGLLVGILVLAALYVLMATALQAYERFVLEGHLKRLNTAKLMEEIEKLRIEVIELRARVGLPAEETKAVAPETGTARFKPELTGGHLPELHLGEFFKYKVLWLRTPQRVEGRKRELINKWRPQEGRDTAWLKVRYAARSVLEIIALIVGWMFVAGAVGNVFLFGTEPAYRQELGGGFIVYVAALSVGMIIALARLMQDRKIRKDAYEEALDGSASGAPT